MAIPRHHTRHTNHNPNNPHTDSSTDTTTVAVDRSGEFLSCAKTALKIGKHQHRHEQHTNDNNNHHDETSSPRAWWRVAPSDLQLHNHNTSSSLSSAFAQRLADGLLLLDTMEEELKMLQALVRRRGHTNDPTQDMAAATKRLEQDTQALTAWLPTLVPSHVRPNGQAAKHYAMIQEWFQQRANAQAQRLQEILKVRAHILAEQARRRQQFQAGGGGGTGSRGSTRSSHTSTSQRARNGRLPTTTTDHYSPTVSLHNNPLFQLAPPQPVVPAARAPPPTTTTHPTTTSTVSTGSGGGYSYYSTHHTAATKSPSPYATGGGCGYGGSGGGTHTSGVGMRQRRTGAPPPPSAQPQEQSLLLQQQQQQEQRQTQRRLREAREAEKGLASLVGLFGKMTTLIQEQSEVIDKIEDDVEAASAHVTQGQHEITKVYSLKKGNRPLILRVFATLILVIVFMRFYRG